MPVVCDVTEFGWNKQVCSEIMLKQWRWDTVRVEYWFLEQKIPEHFFTMHTQTHGYFFTPLCFLVITVRIILCCRNGVTFII